MTQHLPRVAKCFLAVVAVFASPLPVHAEIMDTTGSLRAGKLALGAELQAGFVGDTRLLMLNIHEAVGLASGLDLYARQGIGLSNQPFYVGAGIKWALLGRKNNGPGVALWLGGHLVTSGGAAGADATLVVDHRVGSAIAYLGADVNINFNNSGVDTQLGLLGGLRIGLVQNVAWFVEGGLGLAGNPKPHFLSTGPRISL